MTRLLWIMLAAMVWSSTVACAGTPVPVSDVTVATPVTVVPKELPPSTSIKVPQEDVAQMKRIAAKQWTVPGLDITMVNISAGTFTMGSPKDEDSRNDDETQREVTISKPFYMSVDEISANEYIRLFWPNVNHRGYSDRRGKIDVASPALLRRPLSKRQILPAYKEIENVIRMHYPMACVDFNDARAFCKKINDREASAGRLPEGYEYRLPTEAEWEYACRAGARGMFNQGDEKKIIEEGRLAEEQKSAQRELRKFANVYPGVKRGGYQKQPNAWGLLNMHGGLYEWVLDSYKPYSGSKVTDPLVADTSLKKVIRGGSHRLPYTFLRSAARYSIPFDFNYETVGIRLVLAPKVTIPEPVRPANNGVR